MSIASRTVLWWGRFDPDYSRNRILRQCYAALGWSVKDFHPLLSPIGDMEAVLRGVPRADLVHVPCFRQRDVRAAARFARRQGIPLLFDPLISAYDKQIHERHKYPPSSRAARQVLTAEQREFEVADLVLADTPEHARYFAEQLQVAPAKIRVVAVGAEETLFFPESTPHTPNEPLDVLFYGSFIPLQGPEAIVEAAQVYRGPPVRWTLLGAGPLKQACLQRAAGLSNVHFEDWLPYEQLPARIRQADILLGVFGATPKTQRVIPNKVFQSLACGKPLITCRAPAYPAELLSGDDTGIQWVPAADAAALAMAVSTIAGRSAQLRDRGVRARRTYEQHFATAAIREQLRAALVALRPGSG